MEYTHSLPNEIWHMIFEELRLSDDPKSTLCSLALTCNHLRELSKRALWSEVEMRTDRVANTYGIVEQSVITQPLIGSMINTMDIDFRFLSCQDIFLDSLFSMLPLIPNLRVLRLRLSVLGFSLGSDDTVDEYYYVPPPSAFAATRDSKLREVTIEGAVDNERGYDAGPVVAAFLRARNLQKLVLGTMLIDGHLEEFLDKHGDPSETSLKTLIIDNCHVENEILSRILLSVKGLQTLKLLYPNPYMFDGMMPDCAHVLGQLNAHRKTLECLHLKCYHEHEHAPSGNHFPFSQFTQLKDLVLHDHLLFDTEDDDGLADVSRIIANIPSQLVRLSIELGYEIQATRNDMLRLGISIAHSPLLPKIEIVEVSGVVVGSFHIAGEAFPATGIVERREPIRVERLPHHSDFTEFHSPARVRKIQRGR